MMFRHLWTVIQCLHAGAGGDRMMRAGTTRAFGTLGFFQTAGGGERLMGSSSCDGTPSLF